MEIHVGCSESSFFTGDRSIHRRSYENGWHYSDSGFECYDWVTGFVVFLAGAFRALGQVFAESGDALMTQKQAAGGDKWLRQFLRSCRPLRFEIAHLYVVDPPLLLTMGSFVVENLANLLMVK